MFFQISFLQNFVILTGKQLCWSLFLIKLQARWQEFFFDCYLLIQTTFTTTITTTITTIIFAQSYKNLLDAVDVPWKVNDLKSVTQNP